MKTTLIFLSLLVSFFNFSQDAYFKSGLPISISDKVIFKGSLQIDDAMVTTFSSNANAKFNQNLEVISGTVESDGKFIFENTAEKIFKGNIKIDTISLLSNSKLNISDGTTFQVNDLLELNGQIKTGLINVTVGESIANPGELDYTAGYIDGNMKRWFSASTISNVLFPFGTTGIYSPAEVSYTSAPNGGSLTGKYILNTNSVFPINILDGSDLLENLSGNGFWQIDQTDGMVTGTYSLDLTTNNLNGVNDPTELHLLKRPNLNAAWDQNWEAEGTHVASSESAGFYKVLRTNLSSFSQFGIASPSLNPLPVELVYFNGDCNKDYSILNWQTASESNSSHFEVEKSTNGTDWLKIGEVTAAGNSTELNNYKFQDSNRSIGTAYFRLRQIDIDGNYKIYGPISTSCNDLDFNIEVYPNPANDKCYVKVLSNSIGFVNFQITDNSGKLVGEVSTNIQSGITIIPFDLNDKSSGIYLLKINLNDEILIKKIYKL